MLFNFELKRESKEKMCFTPRLGYQAERFLVPMGHGTHPSFFIKSEHGQRKRKPKKTESADGTALRRCESSA